jgi:tetratricopeptide (TPR) repeat protein
MEIDILKDVVDTLQECQVAHYLMGNVLFYKGRWEEALREWEKALQNGLQNAILYRNIGLAYSILTNEWAKAIEAYEKAIELSPKNQMLYVELDDIYSRIGLFRERIGLLEKAPAEARGYALIARLCSAYVDVGEPDKALNILVNTFFEPSEGYYGFWEIYVDALLAKGLKMLKENEVKGALQYFIEATKYPRNLGVGAPHPNYRSDVLQMYYIGLMHEILGDKESAEKVWSEALQRYTDFVSEHKVFQALILKKLKRDAEAKTLLEKIIAEAKSRAEDVREKVDTAESTIARLFSYDKSLAYIHYVIGIALILYGNITDGLAEIDKALKITSAVRHARWVKEGLLTF